MNHKYIMLLFCIALLSSCGNEYDINEYFDLEELPGYVAFDAPGNSAILDDVMVTEDEGTATVTIECPTGTLSDITVDYDFGGNAVFGTDFNVAGASASGGTITVRQKDFDVVNRSNADLEIELLTDGVADGTKTLTITLVSASNADGPLAVGRGGTDYLKTATVVIEDID
ncbi:MAG: hypothetical protein H6557_05985 [Lewinellaceae bacterium]|nr:hypothetical protein [Phaeodactylibacter sp.]MCB9036155.1 hypothetical protein [Lewinellaceae bacterium]